MPYIKQKNTDQYSNGTYTSLLKVKTDSRPWGSLVVRNQHATANLKYKIMVSNAEQPGSTEWAEEKAEATINGNAAPVKYVLSGPFIWVDVQIMSAGLNESPQASAWYWGVGQ